MGLHAVSSVVSAAVSSTVSAAGDSPFLTDRLPPPDTTMLAVAAAFATALLVLPTFVGFHAVTIVHEGGHALLMQVFGHGVSKVEIHSSGGGTTPSRNMPYFEDLLVTAAGYAAPSLLGLLAADLVVRGLADLVLWGSVTLMVIFLTAARELGTIIRFVAVGAGLGFAALYGTEFAETLVATTWTFVMLIGGLHRVMYRWTDTSDYGVLQDLTIVPPVVWAVVYFFGTIVALVWGGLILVGFQEPFL